MYVYTRYSVTEYTQPLSKCLSITHSLFANKYEFRRSCSISQFFFLTARIFQVYRFILSCCMYTEISSLRNVLIDQRESSCCTLSDGNPNNILFQVRTWAPGTVFFWHITWKGHTEKQTAARRSQDALRETHVSSFLPTLDHLILEPPPPPPPPRQGWSWGGRGQWVLSLFKWSWNNRKLKQN